MEGGIEGGGEGNGVWKGALREEKQRGVEEEHFGTFAGILSAGFRMRGEREAGELGD